MKKIISIFLLFNLFSCGTLKKVTYETITQKQSRISLEKNLRFLSSDSLKGRFPGTPTFEIAAHYLANELSKSKIKPFFNNSYKDTFFTKKATSYNIVGVIESKKSNDTCVLLCAHYDHLGMKRSKKDSIYNGANDNASGVTVVLGIAKFLSNYVPDKKIIIAFFSGEESGLLGSEHLAKRLKENHVNLKYVLNFEMLGKTLTKAENQVYITGFKTSNLSQLVNSKLGKEFMVFLPIEEKQKLFYRSDNYPFYKLFQIPSHTISTFDFKNDPYYHNVKDEYSHLDLDNFNKLVNLSTLMIVELLKDDKQLKLLE
jgi:Zn-dependent M28 family amino/carboxypeptidase